MPRRDNTSSRDACGSSRTDAFPHEFPAFRPTPWARDRLVCASIADAHKRHACWFLACRADRFDGFSRQRVP